MILLLIRHVEGIILDWIWCIINHIDQTSTPYDLAQRFNSLHDICVFNSIFSHYHLFAL